MNREILFVSALLISFVTGAVHAELSTIETSELDAVTGRTNCWGEFACNMSGPGDVIDISLQIITGYNVNDHFKPGNDNIQVGAYQWADDHSSAMDICTAANCFDGQHDMTQYMAHIQNNAIYHGAEGQNATQVIGKMGNGSATRGYGVQYLGGM